jgi:hypothetical protein
VLWEAEGARTASNPCRPPGSPPPLQHQATTPTGSEASSSTARGLLLPRDSFPASPFSNVRRPHRQLPKRRRVNRTRAERPPPCADDVLAWLAGWQRLARQLGCDVTAAPAPPLQPAAAAGKPSPPSSTCSAVLPALSTRAAAAGLSAAHPAQLMFEALPPPRQADRRDCLLERPQCSA